MASAIELYQKAYDLDYGNGDWESAEEIYRKIIERFPQAEEKEYALIHLERIAKLKGTPGEALHTPLRRAVKGKTSGLSVFNLILILLLMGSAGTAIFLFLPHYETIAYQNHLLNGLLSEKLGDSREAVVNYRLAAMAHPQPVVAWRLLSELYLRESQPKLAATAFARWETLSPGDPGLSGFRARLASASLPEKKVEP